MCIRDDAKGGDLQSSNVSLPFGPWLRPHGRPAAGSCPQSD